MVAQGADVCTYVFVYVWVCQGYLLQLQALLISNLLILVRYHLCHFICFACCLCVCGIGGRRACNSRCHWDWLKELQFGAAGLYLQILGGLLMALVLQLTCL